MLGYKIHMVSWDKIYNPKSIGGCEIKNIYWFSHTLSMKIRWIGIFGTYLWCDVLKSKYLKKKSLSTGLETIKK